MAEDFGVEDRGHFYDPVGALRDVVVNHLMQVVAAAAMEPPAGGGPRRSAMRWSTLFRAVRRRPAHYVRGQYDGYRDIDGVAADSTTETYAALRLEIDNWRWSGVPFYIRAGKRLPVTQTELRLVFREPPPCDFGLGAGRPTARADQFVVKLDPSTGARLIVDAHRADGKGPQPITLDMEFADEGGEGATPYEVLLHAAMVGDTGRFKRQDGVEENWRIMQPLIDNPPPVHPYAPGTWGPTIASTLVAGSRRMAGPLDRGVERSAEVSHSSPFPPIADYAFLSDCHTGALVAPDGRSIGCASPRSTPRACSGTCSTERPARSGSARSASTCRHSGRTCRGPTS